MTHPICTNYSIQSKESYRSTRNILVDVCVYNMHPQEITDSTIYLIGDIFNKNGTKDGTLIKTSKIKEFLDGNMVLTESGSIYRLGTPSLEYKKYLNDLTNNIPIPDNCDLLDRFNSVIHDEYLKRCTKQHSNVGTINDILGNETSRKNEVTLGNNVKVDVAWI